MPKLLAFYLPQFHEIEENNLWWGKGFTEWTNVRKAKPLFSGHRQPRIPLDGYYDLLDKSVHVRQQGLARKYGIDAFCYYHYWFNGRRLLSGPVDLIRSEPDLSLPFCLAWANEPWTRSWDGGEHNILMPQEYGAEPEWRAHFEHLLPAFQDPRYLRHETKPVFIIYRLASIPRCNDMIKLWRSLALKAGLPGLHVVGMHTSFPDTSEDMGVDAMLNFEPAYSIHKKNSLLTILRWKCQAAYFYLRLKRVGVIHHLDYRSVWKAILDQPMKEGEYPGAFVGWDNTPRKGRKGLVIEPALPEYFERYLRRQYERALLHKKPFLFINAWNEWAEGAYLEPDTEYGSRYLEAISRVVGNGGS